MLAFVFDKVAFIFALFFNSLLCFVCKYLCFCVFIYIFDLQVVAAMAGEGVGAGSGSICFRKVKYVFSGVFLCEFETILYVHFLFFNPQLRQHLTEVIRR